MFIRFEKIEVPKPKRHSIVSDWTLALGVNALLWGGVVVILKTLVL